MENRNKFFSGGLWCDDDLEQRYKHIKNAFDAYLKNDIDSADLIYIIKNAFVSRIYISEEAKKILDNYSKQAGKDWKLKELYDKICTDGYLELPGETDGLSHFDLCKVIGLQEINSDGKKLGLRIEHVVPGKVYIDYVLDLLKKGEFSFEEFQKIFNKVYICIVTADEAKDLDKGLRDKMPKGKDFKEEPFARYEKKGITIHGLGNNYPKYKCEKL